MAEPSKLIDEHIAKFVDWRGERVWTSQGNVCALGAFKDSVKLNFFNGASLPDPHHLFNGGLDAKASRSIDFAKGDGIDEKALKELVRTAVLHAAKKTETASR